MEQKNAETYQGDLVRSRPVVLFTSETVLALDFEQVLEEAGFRVAHCATCDVSELKAYGPAGILAAVIDVTLHEAAAAQALPWLKRHGIPAVIVGSGAEVVNFERSKFPNIVAEFEKPVIADELVRQFRRYLETAPPDLRPASSSAVWNRSDG
ncbi:hypothetical protein [Thioclava nitratireducens]|uniref:hypothetical protein n=1 Tax=Thioclava nitratireducens TaxID=1915078 RepID=UPI0024807196|nr:hypothetical protein [Thioclava nitratireducens]WGT49764.1 hypothetical protein P0N61_15860 [Thioclava nitratireducens]